MQLDWGRKEERKKVESELRRVRTRKTYQVRSLATPLRRKSVCETNRGSDKRKKKINSIPKRAKIAQMKSAKKG